MRNNEDCGFYGTGPRPCDLILELECNQCMYHIIHGLDKEGQINTISSTSILPEKVDRSCYEGTYSNHIFSKYDLDNLSKKELLELKDEIDKILSEIE